MDLEAQTCPTKQCYWVSQPGQEQATQYYIMPKWMLQSWIQPGSNLPTDAEDQEQINYFFITCLISMVTWCNVLTWENMTPAHKSHSEKAPWGQSMWQDHWGAAVRQRISCLAAQAVFAFWRVDFLSNFLSKSFTFTNSTRNTCLEHKWYYNTIIYI